MSLSIPPVPKRLQESVRALVRTASLLESVVVAMAEGKSFEGIAVPRLEALEVASKVIRIWRKHIGMDIEDPTEGGRNGD